MISVFVVKSEAYNAGFKDTSSVDISISVHKDESLLESFDDLPDYIDKYLHNYGLSAGPDKDKNYLVLYQRRWVTVVQCIGDFIVAIDCERLQYNTNCSSDFNITMHDLHRLFKYYG